MPVGVLLAGRGGCFGVESVVWMGGVAVGATAEEEAEAGGGDECGDGLG